MFKKGAVFSHARLTVRKAEEKTPPHGGVFTDGRNSAREEIPFSLFRRTDEGQVVIHRLGVGGFDRGAVHRHLRQTCFDEVADDLLFPVTLDRLAQEAMPDQDVDSAVGQFAAGGDRMPVNEG